MLRVAVVAVLFCLLGCGRAHAPQVVASMQYLMLTQEMGPGERGCAHGGVLIQQGFDSNRDGDLTSNEVSRTEIKCHSAPPAPAEQPQPPPQQAQAPQPPPQQQQPGPAWQ